MSGACLRLQFHSAAGMAAEGLTLTWWAAAYDQAAINRGKPIPFAMKASAALVMGGDASKRLFGPADRAWGRCAERLARFSAKTPALRLTGGKSFLLKHAWRYLSGQPKRPRGAVPFPAYSTALSASRLAAQKGHRSLARPYL